ncbi:MAG: hypothetical protein ACI4QR_03770, partial [Eubacteriales bacterium]
RITFPAAKDIDIVHHYNVNVCAGTIIKNYKILSDFYKHPQVYEMSGEISLLLGTPILPGEKISVSVIAVNSWGKESDVAYAECVVE